MNRCVSSQSIQADKGWAKDQTIGLMLSSGRMCSHVGSPSRRSRSRSLLSQYRSHTHLRSADSIYRPTQRSRSIRSHLLWRDRDGPELERKEETREIRQTGSEGRSEEEEGEGKVAAGCGETGGDRREEEAEVSLRGSGRCTMHKVVRRALGCELTEPCCFVRSCSFSQRHTLNNLNFHPISRPTPLHSSFKTNRDQEKELSAYRKASTHSRCNLFRPSSHTHFPGPPPGSGTNVATPYQNYTPNGTAWGEHTYSYPATFSGRPLPLLKPTATRAETYTALPLPVGSADMSSAAGAGAKGGLQPWEGYGVRKIGGEGGWRGMSRYVLGHTVIRISIDVLLKQEGLANEMFSL
jgi:hypothetical protein